MLRKSLRLLLLIFSTLIGCLIIFLLFAIGIIDRTPASDLPGYQTAFDQIENLSLPHEPDDSVFSVGFSTVNLTPDEPVALAGYGNRKGKRYTRVADSIFIRAIVVDNGATKVAIVSADLLLIPPKVTETLPAKLQAIGFPASNVFLGATHTHNSIGNWGEGATRFIYGAYDQAIVDFIADRIVDAIAAADRNKAEGVISYGKIAVPSAVDNRLIKDGVEDPYLRIVEVNRGDNKKLVLLSYTAHATCLYSRDLELSRDYPGKLVDHLEQEGYDFAMFMAGSVGSHRPAAPTFGWPCFDWMTGVLSNAVKANRNNLIPVKGRELMLSSVDLSLGDPQVKVTEKLKIRSWLFRSALGEYPAAVTSLRIGDLLMIGTPADFSGEFNEALDAAALERGLNVMVTSFNGGYVGYLTPEKYYDNKYFETQLMNWYAPGTGEYVRDVMISLINHQKSNSQTVNH
jgi:neutral ceramidase